MSHFPTVTDVLIKSGKFKHRFMDIREQYVVCEDMDTVGRWPREWRWRQELDCHKSRIAWGHYPKLEEAREDLPVEPLESTWPCQNRDFRLSDFITKTILVLCLAPQFVAPCYSCPRKPIQKDTWILKVLSLWSEELLLSHHILHRLSRLLSVGWTRASQTLLCIVFTCKSFINTAVWLPPPEMLV